MSKFNFLDKVVDQVTGIKGVITARVWMLSGCFRYEMMPIGKDETIYVDEDSCKLLKKSNYKIEHKPFIFELGDYVKSVVGDEKFVIKNKSHQHTGFNRYLAENIKNSKYRYFEENEIVSCKHWFKSSVLEKKQVAKQKKEMNPSPSKEKPISNNKVGV